MHKQIVLVSLATDHKDYRLYADGQLIARSSSFFIEEDHSANQMIETVADNLAAASRVEVTKVDYERTDDEKINETKLRESLQAQGIIAGGLKNIVVDYSAMDNTGEVVRDVAGFQAEDLPHAIEQLINERGSDEPYLLWVDTPKTDKEPILNETGENEYRLNPRPYSCCKITVGTFAIYIKQTEEGVIVDAYPHDEDGCGASIGLMFSEGLPGANDSLVI